MSDFRLLRGFEEAWRPPVRLQRPETVLGAGGGAAARARLARLVRRAPEVMVKVTGRTRDAGHLRAHLEYITRRGLLEAEGPDGVVSGRDEVQETAQAWADATEMEPRRWAGAPLSLSLVLSMPAGTDALRLHAAARAFAQEAFGDERDWLMALHTDADHPHVHLTVCALGWDGRRLNPRKADLEAWRQGFARALRDHGIEAEATPRRARGVARKAERGAVRRMRERWAAGQGAAPRVLASALREAASGGVEEGPWAAARRRRAVVQGLYAAQALALARAADPADRALGAQLAAFAAAMPEPETRRERLARALRRTVDRDALGGGPDRSRGR
ncbi:relaxase/mobilization nuclease domain-containing protein [Phenylobacterium deserti]|uniref:relaxase/mobilization nuclease domain-containing protein n=1 Tax=Phenylobacterium deserti TaxID=1914756 RepID=UPI001F0C47A4|nr:relaxase/mobilization nuclease domain-containing protein [Phenylobacterium deserti]